MEIFLMWKCANCCSLFLLWCWWCTILLTTTCLLNMAKGIFTQRSHFTHVFKQINFFFGQFTYQRLIGFCTVFGKIMSVGLAQRCFWSKANWYNITWLWKLDDHCGKHWKWHKVSVSVTCLSPVKLGATVNNAVFQCVI